jgi:hypothetical protein
MFLPHFLPHPLAGTTSLGSPRVGLDTPAVRPTDYDSARTRGHWGLLDSKQDRKRPSSLLSIPMVPIEPNGLSTFCLQSLGQTNCVPRILDHFPDNPASATRARGATSPIIPDGGIRTRTPLPAKGSKNESTPETIGVQRPRSQRIRGHPSRSITASGSRFCNVASARQTTTRSAAVESSTSARSSRP